MQFALVHQPFVAATRLTQRRKASLTQQQARRGQLQQARAESFNEGAAQVRRLVDRDRKELDLDELEASFAADPAAQPATPSSAAAADGAAGSSAEAVPRSPFMATPSAADKTPVSPFGPSSGSSGSSPFGSPAAGVKRPFAEPAGLSPNMPTPKQDTTPWWTKITLTQVVIVLSFTTIISLMVATFFFVLGTGAIRFNE